MIGKRISHYQILEELGRGGMGVVYKAKDLRLLRPVAIKFLSHELIHDPKALRRFQHEAIAASAINHPNICIIYEIDSFRSDHFIVMEFIDGKTLREMLSEQGALSEALGCDILTQTYSALQAAHEGGIVHRDIKPSNIMIYDKTGVVKVTDFGLAKLASETAKLLVGEERTVDDNKGKTHDVITTSLLTTFTGLMGTATYMSPEQAKQESVDQRTDIFSLGIVTFEMLTGTWPFQGKNQTEMLESIVKRSPASLDEVNPKINRLWGSMIDKTLQKDVEQRYQTISQMTDDLEKIKLSLPASKTREKGKVRQTRVRRYRRAIAFSVAAVLAFVLFLVFGDYFSKGPQVSQQTQELQHLDVTTNSLEAYNYFLEGQKDWWRYDNLSAIDHLQMAVDIDSSFAYANALLGVLFRWRDRLDEAGHCFSRAERSIPLISEWEKLLVKGFVAYWHDRNEEMVAYFNELIEKYPDKFDGYFGEALAYETLDDYDQAIEVTKRILNIDSTHISAHGNLADLYKLTGDYGLAEKYARREVELFEASGELSGIDGAYDMLGRIYHLEAKGKDAIVNFEKSIEISPRNLDAYRFLAEAYALNGEVDKAEQVISQALGLPLKINQRINVYWWLANIEVLGGQFVDGLSSYEKAKNLCIEARDGKGFLNSVTSVCHIYAEMKHLDLMDKEWQNAQRQFSQPGFFTVPQDTALKWGPQFRVALARGDFDLARQSLSKIGKIHGEDSRYYQALLALLYYEQDAYSKAALILHQLIKPTDRLVDGHRLNERYYLAMILKQAGEFDEAVENCRQILRARRITEDQFFVYYKALALLSEIYELLGENDKSERYCAKFLELWKNSDPETHLFVKVKERSARLRETHS